MAFVGPILLKTIFVDSLKTISTRALNVKTIACCSNCQLERSNLKPTAIHFPPKNTKKNWIGPPDAVSNLRPIEIYIPDDETVAERNYRLKLQKVQKWNQKFWENHNASFFTDKEDYIARKIGPSRYNDDGTQKTLSAEELSEFYKKFLDDNHKKHWAYNTEWYRKNISLLWPAFKSKLSRILVKIQIKR